MLKDFDFKKVLPDGAAILIFLLVVFFFFQPLFDGKQLKQADIVNHKGMSKEIVDHRNAFGEEPLWSNAMFGGMPAYQISVYYGTNFLSYIDKYIFRLGLPRPADYLFIYMLGFFILLRTLKLNSWLSLIGAIAFAFSSYFIIILEAGHNSKAHAIGYMAPTLAFIILTFRGKYLVGGILTALFLGLQLYANHPQITYYLGIIVLILGITELVKALKDKTLPGFIKSSAVLLVAAGLAFSTNIGSLLTTLEYSPYTIRGKAELTFDKHDKSSSGLDKGYATQWSYGKAETFSLMIPNAKGGASGYLQEHEKAMEKVDNQFKSTVARQNSYWGDQPFTSGPVYVGAIMVFLFVLGLFLVKSELKWVFLAATLLSIFLAWGKNMMWFTDFFLDYVPMYNKFRAVSMILVIAQFSIAVLAMLTLKELFTKPEVLKENRKGFYISLGLTAGLSFIFYIAPTMFFDFFSQAELEQLPSLQAQDPQNAAAYQAIFDNMELARITIFKADAIRAFFFILVAAAVSFLFSMKKLPKIAFLSAIGLLIIIDILSVDSRYISEKNYERKRKNEVVFTPSQADLQILQDKDPNFRVFNTTVSTFQDASTSYFHKSLGGYHGAKFRRYQDLIDYHLSQFNMPVINMLNTKYFIQQSQDGQVFAQPNYGALGNAWFVDDLIWVDSPDDEINHLGTLVRIENLNPNASFEVYGRPLNSVDTVLLTVPIKILQGSDGEVIDEINLDKLKLGFGQKYILGVDMADTTPGYIYLSEIKRKEMLVAQQFAVEVISSFNPTKEAIIDRRFYDQIKDFDPQKSASYTIKLESYKPNHLVYKSQSAVDGFAVFSEIYYDKGWNAYIDDQKTDYVRVNYVLRGMKLPSGEHKIEFKFEPKSYKIGSTINFISSLIVVLLVGFLVFVEIRKQTKKV